MARFPKSEAEVVALASQMIYGFGQYTETFSPPVSPEDLAAALTAFNTAKNAQTIALADAETATNAKNEALEELIEFMKSDIRYAENAVNFDDDMLKVIGWSGRKTATALEAPGQARLLEAPKQGAGWLFLDWKAPTDGGKPAAYKVLRRERPAGAWMEVATAIDSEATLTDQPTVKELEYQVIAVNKTGDGEPSNTVMAVL